MTRSYSSILFWLGLAIASSLLLYRTSDQATALERQLRSVNAQIEVEQERMRVLKAEWVYLANPARIEAAAARHLGMKPTTTRRVSTLPNMSALVPLRGGVDPMPAVQVAQAAAPAAPAAAQPAPKTKRDRIMATLNAGRINDRMVMQSKTASVSSVEASTDKIGTLIGSLSLRP